MKRAYTLLVFTLIETITGAQNYLWPIKGYPNGETIISQPQQYIEDSINYEFLYISANYGSEVVSPVDGVISDIYIAERPTRFSLNYWDIQEGCFDNKIEEIISSEEHISVPLEYLSGNISIRTKDESFLEIGGLKGNVNLKEGMVVHRGDVIGTVGYDYKFFSIPHISLRILSKNWDIMDPMSPFGLPSSFKAPEKVIPVDHLSQNQAEEDLNILLNAYKECYPSFNDRVTPLKFESFRDSCIALVNGGIDYIPFYYIIRNTTTQQFINDSHLYLLTKLQEGTRNFYVPQLKLGVCGDSLIVTSTTIQNSQYLGKRVKYVNGIEESHWIQQIIKNQIKYDEDAIMARRDEMLSGWNYTYGIDAHTLRAQEITFSDGTKYLDKWIKANSQERVPKLENVSYYKNRVQAEEHSFTFSSLNDSTLLFSINTFSLLNAEIEEIADSLKANSHCPNLIIDLRNNNGGDQMSMSKILSFFLENKLNDISPYEIVTSNKSYDSFKYSRNFPEGSTPFLDFQYDEQLHAFCKLCDWEQKMILECEPYSGKIYILIGERTFSAATLFAAYLVRSNRAVTVGRETPTGYHSMNASKFLDLHLPNSGIDIRIPLVKCVFDEVVTERTPAKRGLLPDYEIPFSYEEYYFSCEDIILNETLQLIENNKYLSPHIFRQVGQNTISKTSPLIIIISAFILAFSFYFVIKRKRKLLSQN